MSFMLVIDKNLEGECFILSMKGDDLWWDDDFVAEMWVVLTLLLEEGLSFGYIVDREEISDFRIFEFGFLIFLLSPIIASIHILFWIHHLFEGLFILHDINV